MSSTLSNLSASSDAPAAAATALERALAQAPFYESWRAHDPGPGTPLAQRFAALPITTKRDLRAHMPKGFVPRDCDRKAGLADGTIELVTTSGTTEDRASIVWHQPWWDRSEQSAAALHAGLAEVVRAAPREAVLTTPLCGGNVCHVGDLSMAERTLGRLLFLNQKLDPTRWTPAEMDRMLSELEQFQPQLLDADPAYLAILSRRAVAHGRPVHQPRFVTLTYEFPSLLHLRAIRLAFPSVPLVSSYGSTETGHVFTQCECGTFHQNTDTCHVDLQPLASVRLGGDASPYLTSTATGRANRPGEPQVGRILVTMLENPWVSLLRFDVGDLGRLAEAPCPCGRTAGITLAGIEGRVRDLTFAMDGRPVTVGELDRAVGNIDPLLAYRLEQTAREAYLFRFVAEPGAEAAVAAEAAATLLRLYGPGVHITTQRESVLVPEPSGKFRLAETRFAWAVEGLFERQNVEPGTPNVEVETAATGRGYRNAHSLPQ